jgi:outer membrane protein
MNQKVVNIIFALGIIVLLVLNFTKKTASTPFSSAVNSEASKSLKVAYVDLDSIQEKYVYYQEKMNEFDKKKEAADRDLNAAFQKIDNERIAFLKKGQSITQAEAESFQQMYQGKMQNLDQQKKVLENKIAEEGMKTMDELKKRMNDFIVEFNKEKKYSYIFSHSSAINFLFYKDTTYNITNEVVEGLNQAYKKQPQGK